MVAHLGCVSAVDYWDMCDDYEQELSEWESAVGRLYDASFRSLGDDDSDSDSDEILVKRRVETSVVRRLMEYLSLHGDGSLACRGARDALVDGVSVSPRRMVVLIPESSREWLRLHRDDLMAFLGGRYDSEIERLIGRGGNGR